MRSPIVSPSAEPVFLGGLKSLESPAPRVFSNTCSSAELSRLLVITTLPFSYRLAITWKNRCDAFFSVRSPSARRPVDLTGNTRREANVPRVLLPQRWCCGTSGQADQTSMEHPYERSL